MKINGKRVVLTLAVMALTWMAEAKPVSAEQARRVAERYLGQVELTVRAMEEMYLVTPAAGEGFVLVAADDCVRPVLAYSTRGHFETEGMPAHVAAWLDGYRREIASLRAAGAVASKEVAALWLGKHPATKSEADTIGPLMTTQWDQAPYYNKHCPYDYTNSMNTYTGCVATAMAQVMKYWNHPATGWGSHSYTAGGYGTLSVDFGATTYQWDSMPDNLGWWSDSVQVAAVATLMYHAGVAVEMNYGTDGSGAQVISYGSPTYPCSENALRSYFKYSPMLRGVSKAEYSDSEWKAILVNELANGRPILYAGFDATSGHAFVFDGYDGQGMFHVNWGWGGYQDGYYTVDSLSPGVGGIGGNATYTFNVNNQAVIGVEPVTTTADGVAEVAMVADSAMGHIVGNGTYTAFVDTVAISAQADEGYRFAQWVHSGSMVNPLQFVVTGDMHDTALFLPVGTDTLCYSHDRFYSAWHDDYSSYTEWGIRIPASLRHSARQLHAVQIYIAQQDLYTLNIYAGDSISEQNLLYNEVIVRDFSNATHRWNTFELETPVAVPDNETLWITVKTHGGGYPAAFSRYTGNSNGSWYKLPDGWAPLDQNGFAATWMIRALFSERQYLVMAEQAEGSQCNMDLLYGTGSYDLGDTAIVGITDDFFTHWGNAGLGVANPVSIIVEGDTVLHPYCISVGIDPATSDELRAMVIGHTVVASAEAELYDAVGRLVGRGLRIEAPATGVYILRMGQGSKRIIIL